MVRFKVALNSIYQKYRQMTNFYPPLTRGLWAPKLNRTWVDRTQINITTSSLCCFEIKLLSHHSRFEEGSLSCQECCHDVLSPSSVSPFGEFVVWGRKYILLRLSSKKQNLKDCWKNNHFYLNWILDAEWEGVDLNTNWLQLTAVY